MSNSNELELAGLDGANPLSFLAALGTIRTLGAIQPGSQFEMKWCSHSGKWTPSIRTSDRPLDRDGTCSTLIEYLEKPPQWYLFESIGDNLTLSPQRFRHLAEESISTTDDQRVESTESNDRLNADLMAAFGSDGTFQPHSKDHSLIQDTALRTMSGAGHQHFIRFMREIIEQTTATHLYETLFENWRYQDEGRGLNLRWDPVDDRRYAMRWKNPSADPNMTMRGANRLAIEALPLFPTAVVGTKLETTGFKTIPRKGTFWYWPIWNRWLPIDSIKTILQHPAISQEESLNLPKGIVTTFKSQRITVGKFRNFTPAVPVSYENEGTVTGVDGTQ